MSKAGFFTPTELAFGLTIGKNEAVQPFDFTAIGSAIGTQSTAIGAAPGIVHIAMQ